jgi:hypothetical protein
MNMDYRLLGITCAAVFACSGNESIDPRYDSGSHWLTVCEADAECGSLQCECGFCTYRCEDTSECPAGLCFNPRTATSCESVELAICGMLCDDASECDDGDACVEGVCIRTSSVEPDAGGDAPTDTSVDADPDADASSDTDPSDTDPSDTGPSDTDPSDTDPDASDAGDVDVDDDADDGRDAGTVDADAPHLELCEELECGEMLTVASWRCPDGSAAGEMCARVSEELCEWTIRECPQEVLSCYGTGDCPDEMVCNASELCVTDPECPTCDVCFGWCVDPATACLREECGSVPETAHYRCDDASLAGPLCERDSDDVCEWRERTCD